MCCNFQLLSTSNLWVARFSMGRTIKGRDGVAIPPCASAGLLTGHDPVRGSGQEACEKSRAGSGREFSKLTGRVGPGRVGRCSITGWVGSGGFQTSRAKLGDPDLIRPANVIRKPVEGPACTTITSITVRTHQIYHSPRPRCGRHSM